MLMEGIVIQTIHIVSDFEMCYVIFFFFFFLFWKLVAGGLLRIIEKLHLCCHCDW